MRKQTSILYLFILSSLVFYFSCRKSEHEILKPETPFSIERFFNLPASADPRLKAIAKSIRAQEKEHQFLEKFIKTAGWPRWDKSKIIGPQNRNNGRSNEDSSSLVYIPFVIDTVNTVKVVLAVNMEASDTAWQTLHANNYQAFGFDSTNSNNWNARDVFQFFALFDHDIFGHTKFRLKDSLLFNTPRNSIITLKSIDGVPVNGRTNRVASYVDVCSQWEICDPPHEGWHGDPIVPGGGGGTQTRITSCYYTNNCVTYYYFNWSSGGSGSPGNGSGGGGSNSGGWWSTPTCTNTSTGTPIACPPGWVPVYTGFNISSITSDFTNPCIVAAKNKLPDNMLKIFAAELLIQTEINQEWSISFIEDRNLVAPGTTDPMHAESYPTSATKTWNVSLNPMFWEQATYPNATQEFAGVSILHEIIHGCIYVYKEKYGLTTLNNLTTHEALFKNFILIYRQALMTAFGLTQADATALALAGLDDVLQKEYAANGTLSSYNADYNQFAIDNYQINIPDAEAIAEQYLVTGTKGVKCF